MTSRWLKKNANPETRGLPKIFTDIYAPNAFNSSDSHDAPQKQAREFSEDHDL